MPVAAPLPSPQAAAHEQCEGRLARSVGAGERPGPRRRFVRAAPPRASPGCPVPWGSGHSLRARRGGAKSRASAIERVKRGLTVTT